MVRNRVVFSIEIKDLKKTVNPHNLFVLFPRIEAVVGNEGCFNVLKGLSDPKD